MSDTQAAPISGPDLAAMDSKPVADSAPPAGSREAELAQMAIDNPGPYRWSEGGKHAAEHLRLRKERLEGKQVVDDTAGNADLADADEGDADDADLSLAEDERADEKETARATDVPTDPDERAEYLPDEASGYDNPAVEGVTWSQPLLDSFKTAAHEMEFTQGHVDKLGAWYFAEQKKVEAGWKDADAEQRKATKAQLSREDYEAANTGWKAAGKELRAQAQEARLPDGRSVATLPWFAKLMAQAGRGRQQGDAAPTGSDQVRFEELTRVLHSDINRYNSERTGRRNGDGSWQTLADEHLALRRKLEARKWA